MDLTVLVKAHSGIAILALLIYVIRGAMMLADSPKTNSRPVLSIASIVTIALFGLGVYLGFIQHMSFAEGFILSKIIGLLLFVAFGVTALKKGLSKLVASILWLLGLGAFIYTYLIAVKILTPLF